MRTLLGLAFLALSALAGCASARALREARTDAVQIRTPAERDAYFRAAAWVMTRDGQELLYPAEPEGFGVYRGQLRDEDGDACEGVRLDATFRTTDEEAVLALAPCQVEAEAKLHRENGVEICAPQRAWAEAACIDSALRRLKAAWRAEAQGLLAEQGSAGAAAVTGAPTR
jgi:hypothetical protein